MNNITKLAKVFVLAGGMDADTAIAEFTHTRLVDAIEASTDYCAALELAQSIVNNFNY